MSRGRREINIFSLPLASGLAISFTIIELIVKVVNILLIIITINSRLTFKPLVSGLALGACLVPIFTLILITRPTNRKGTLITRNKYITISSHPNSITTDLTYLTIQILQGLRLTIRIMADPNQLIPLVRSSNQPSTCLHFFFKKQRVSTILLQQFPINYYNVDEHSWKQKIFWGGGLINKR
nr:hypothetical protein Iba_chr01cCG5370 [Ipomoea batatas]